MFSYIFSLAAPKIENKTLIIERSIVELGFLPFPRHGMEMLEKKYFFHHTLYGDYGEEKILVMN